MRIDILYSLQLAQLVNLRLSLQTFCFQVFHLLLLELLANFALVHGVSVDRVFFRDLDLFLESVVFFLEVAQAVFKELFFGEFLLFEHGFLELARSFHLRGEVLVFWGQGLEG